ncbi:MAG TPA: tetratricopeptide repeat protein [Saprospiraceae bacterium]|nr:tetratricopeptide repeat protein [Saprospiraceae bacterium]HRG66156.1 tetratricopeptide repeat protein [Saprospiraceae bacterium]
MNRTQFIAIGAALVLFLAMYFGCETRPAQVRNLEKSRSLSLEVTGIENLMQTARKKLSASDLATLDALTASMGEDSVAALEMLSSKWYELGDASIAGHYAEELALLKNDEQSWSIAGTTYLLGLKSATEDKVRAFCKSKALAAFEKALSLNPSNVDHKINKALCYVEMADENNPMQGILMLRELNQQYPENVNVMVQLARLALKTNQLDRAKERLQQALSLDPSNNSANCLMAETLEAAGDTQNAAMYRSKCKK